MDESGNTGSNICDKNQRYFILSAVSFSDDELNQLKTDINYPQELHFVKMKDSVAGRLAIKNLLNHSLINSQHVSYQFIDKNFCIYAQITDMIIEPVFHYILNEDLYKQRMNIMMANCLHIFSEKHSHKDLVDEFKRLFMVMMREQSTESISNFYNSVHQLKENTTNELIDLLVLIEMSESILNYIMIEDNKYCLDTTLTSLISLTNHWYNKYKTKIEIITDNSKQLAYQEHFITKLSNIKNECYVGYDTRKHTYPLPIYKFSMVDSAKSFGVQIADMIASAVSFRCNESTKKYQKFHDELKELDFFNLPCYPISPSSYEELMKSVDDSEDIDPFNFLIQNLK